MVLGLEGRPHARVRILKTILEAERMAWAYADDPAPGLETVATKSHSTVGLIQLHASYRCRSSK